jgi:Domain of unknown function (DUF4188)
MAQRTVRETVDLSQYPDLVVIYLGMRVRSPRGLRTLLRAGPRIQRSVAARPDGLLRHENLLYSLAPPHVGMRQYWRDFDALERWSRSDPHRGWWNELLADPGGPVSGTRPTSPGAALRRSTWSWTPRRPGWAPSHPGTRPASRVLRPPPARRRR